MATLYDLPTSTPPTAISLAAGLGAPPSGTAPVGKTFGLSAAPDTVRPEAEAGTYLLRPTLVDATKNGNAINYHVTYNSPFAASDVQAVVETYLISPTGVGAFDHIIAANGVNLVNQLNTTDASALSAGNWTIQIRGRSGAVVTQWSTPIVVTI